MGDSVLSASTNLGRFDVLSAATLVPFPLISVRCLAEPFRVWLRIPYPTAWLSRSGPRSLDQFTRAEETLEW